MELPRDCALQIIKRLDMDGRRALGIPPRRLRVPDQLKELMEARPGVRQWDTNYYNLSLGGIYTFLYVQLADGKWFSAIFPTGRISAECYCRWCGADNGLNNLNQVHHRCSES